MFIENILLQALTQFILVSAYPQNAGSVAAAAASAAVASASSPTSLPPPGPLVNVTAQTPVNGTASIMTGLVSYSGCDDGQKKIIDQAFIDALNIVGTVGGTFGPAYIFTGNPVSDPDNKVNPPWDYFGSSKRTEQSTKDQIISRCRS